MKENLISKGKDLLIKFKIPTLLGLSIIIIGIITGVFLTLKEQIFISRASPDITAKNITLSNISDTEVTISWQTSAPTISFVTFGQTNPNEQTVINDKDSSEPENKPKIHLIHYVTIKNLLPKTTYQYKVITGKIASNVGKFTTATPINQQVGFRPIIGSVLWENKPLEESIVYLSITNATLQSAQVKAGNFLIPLSQIRKTDLSDSYSLSEDTVGKLTVISEQGNTNALFNLKTSSNPLPPLKLNQDIDLTIESTPVPASSTAQELVIYDLNGDHKINAADNAIILQNFGKKGKRIKGDLNSDGVVDQKDLDLMTKQINQ